MNPSTLLIINSIGWILTTIALALLWMQHRRISSQNALARQLAARAHHADLALAALVAHGMDVTGAAASVRAHVYPPARSEIVQVEAENYDAWVDRLVASMATLARPK